MMDEMERKKLVAGFRKFEPRLAANGVYMAFLEDGEVYTRWHDDGCEYPDTVVLRLSRPYYNENQRLRHIFQYNLTDEGLKRLTEDLGEAGVVTKHCRSWRRRRE